ncbi:hypothetical protein [Pontibacter ruber]|uniref:Uncharacterized protein n=1 Tax=Pontibacter ruber TaxID=1343895 RepID=A0ABW5CTG3_9BACT|nr:hypothetical protein [Pontibacter ruber]
MDPDPEDLEDPLVELLLFDVVDLFASVLPEVEEDLEVVDLLVSPFEPWLLLVGITQFVFSL